MDRRIRHLRSGSVSRFRRRIRLRFGGVNAPIGHFTIRKNLVLLATAGRHSELQARGLGPASTDQGVDKITLYYMSGLKVRRK
jgi:hypothetical protein